MSLERESLAALERRTYLAGEKFKQIYQAALNRNTEILLAMSGELNAPLNTIDRHITPGYLLAFEGYYDAHRLLLNYGAPAEDVVDGSALISSVKAYDTSLQNDHSSANIGQITRALWDSGCFDCRALAIQTLACISDTLTREQIAKESESYYKFRISTQGRYGYIMDDVLNSANEKAHLMQYAQMEDNDAPARPADVAAIARNREGLASQSMFNNQHQELKHAEPPVEITVAEAEQKLNHLREQLEAFADESSTHNDFLCPITLSMMEDPVMLADGHSYERSAITTWFSNHQTSPKTGVRLHNMQMTPNHALKGSIDTYNERKQHILDGIQRIENQFPEIADRQDSSGLQNVASP